MTNYRELYSKIIELETKQETQDLIIETLQEILQNLPALTYDNYYNKKEVINAIELLTELVREKL